VIISRRMRWAGHVVLWVEKRNVYRTLVENPEGKRLLGRPRLRWDGSKSGGHGLDSIDSE
jgi:hypothetical protein